MSKEWIAAALVVERRQYDDDQTTHNAGIGIASKVPVTILTFLPLQPGLALTPP
jgi:hypothetical protein